MSFKKSYQKAFKTKENSKLTSYQRISKNKNAINFDFSEEDQELVNQQEKKLPNIIVNSAEVPLTSDEINISKKEFADFFNSVKQESAKEETESHASKKSSKGRQHQFYEKS